ncbi:MAG: 1-acyl-sn-glycerol-3-phosphate acyltransferase [Candidatus Komeilibacteria bacterium]
MSSSVNPTARLRWTVFGLWSLIQEYAWRPAWLPIRRYVLRPPWQYVLRPIWRYALGPTWLLIWQYVLYPVIQWIVIFLTMIYVILAYTVFNKLEIIGKENLVLRDSGDVLASWHESMCDSFAIGAAIGLSMIWRQNAIPWNFAAAENFMTRWWSRTLVTMLKTYQVKSSESGKRADSGALRYAIKLLQFTNVILFPAGTRFRPGQTEDPVASAGFGLTVLKAKRVIPIAFVGMGGVDGLQPYRKTRFDGPPTKYAIFGRYIDWVMGIRFGQKVTMIVGEPIEVEELAAVFAHMPDREQQIANLVMRRICDLRRQILH